MNPHRKCSKCMRIFAFERETQEMCSGCEEEFKSRENLRCNAICKYCGDPFYAADLWKGHLPHLQCPYCRISPARRKTNHCEVRAKTESYQKRVEEANKRWEEDKPDNRRKISYDELNRRAEWKRLYDERGHEHYYKGRKWDKI